MQTRPAIIMRAMPRRAMSQPLASEGRYIAIRCEEITCLVAAMPCPSITCMLIGVAVMMKLITAYEVSPANSATR